MPKVCIILLGCDKNRIDAEIMAGKLSDAGYVMSGDPQESDIIIINTCGFIEASKKESIDVIFDMARLKKENRNKHIVVTGCLAERYRDTLVKEIPEADAVIGIGKNGDIVKLIEKMLSSKPLSAFDDPENLPLDGERLLSTPLHYAYLKIAEGCSNRCSYCAIPDIRGRFRSRKPENIIREARLLAEKGVKELILVAQDTTAYGRDLDGGHDLPVLLERLAMTEGIWKIRILYAYPDNITDKLIMTIGQNEKIAKYLDVPMQHADGGILKMMGRSGNKETLLALVGRLRQGVPGIALRSSFMAGFPGEGEKEFCELMDFIRRAEIDRAGCFAFSPEEGTGAFGLGKKIPEKVKNTRVERFMAKQTQILQTKQQARTGQTLEVIIDGFDKHRGMYAARSELDAPEVDTVVYIHPEAGLKTGNIINVKITGYEGYDLFGEPSSGNGG